MKFFVQVMRRNKLKSLVTTIEPTTVAASQSLLCKALKVVVDVSGKRNRHLPTYSLALIYWSDHAGVWDNSQADLLTSRTPVVGALKENEGDIPWRYSTCLRARKGSTCGVSILYFLSLYVGSHRVVLMYASDAGYLSASLTVLHAHRCEALTGL